MKLFRRGYKKFDYNPRYYKGEGNPYEIRHKFDDFRTTTGKNKGLKGKFNQAIDELRSDDTKGVNKTILIIIGVLVLLFLFIIDFDLSIFVNN